MSQINNKRHFCGSDKQLEAFLWATETVSGVFCGSEKQLVVFLWVRETETGLTSETGVVFCFLFVRFDRQKRVMCSWVKETGTFSWVTDKAGCFESEKTHTPHSAEKYINGKLMLE